MANIKMNFKGNVGYGPNQVDTKISLAHLLEQVQDAIEQWGEDTTVVLYQTNNGRGANYGSLSGGWELFEGFDEEDGDL